VRQAEIHKGRPCCNKEPFALKGYQHHDCRTTRIARVASFGLYFSESDIQKTRFLSIGAIHRSFQMISRGRSSNFGVDRVKVKQTKASDQSLRKYASLSPIQHGGMDPCCIKVSPGI